MGDCQIITFTVAVPIPSEITMAGQELQAAISYFESEGLTIEPSNPKAAYLTHGTVVNFESVEKFDFCEGKWVLTIVKFDEISVFRFVVMSLKFCQQFIVFK